VKLFFKVMKVTTEYRGQDRSNNGRKAGEKKPTERAERGRRVNRGGL